MIEQRASAPVRAPVREVIWVPVIHAPADLGTAQSSVRALYVQRFGQEGWDAHIRTIADWWQRIQAALAALALDYAHVRLYQDGLPVCGREQEIVRELAAHGSPNHELLAQLMARGATLVGTEAPELLLAEYEAMQQLLAAAGTGAVPGPTPGQEARRQALLQARDQYIAARIEQTLQPGETGLLFLGLLHSLEGRLSPALHVTRLRL